MALTYEHAGRSSVTPASTPAFSPGLQTRALIAPYARNEEIFAEEDDAKFVYKVVSGAVRITRMLSDGRRCISAFCLPGEVFGMEAGGVHSFAAEAIVDSHIALARRSAIESEVSRNPEAGRAMWTLAMEEARRLQEHVLLLGRRSAVQRVATLLLDLADRMQGRDVVDAPMSRSDMGDYLGLTIETVSRSLSQLERNGLIAMPSTRRIVLRNRAALAALDD